MQEEEEEEELSLEEVVAGLAQPNKVGRLGRFQILHEDVSGDTRKALAMGHNRDVWQAIHQATIFQPSWFGIDQPGRVNCSGGHL